MGRQRQKVSVACSRKTEQTLSIKLTRTVGHYYVTLTLPNIIWLDQLVCAMLHVFFFFYNTLDAFSVCFTKRIHFSSSTYAKYSISETRISDCRFCYGEISGKRLLLGQIFSFQGVKLQTLVLMGCPLLFHLAGCNPVRTAVIIRPTSLPETFPSGRLR